VRSKYDNCRDDTGKKKINTEFQLLLLKIQYNSPSTELSTAPSLRIREWRYVSTHIKGWVGHKDGLEIYSSGYIFLPVIQNESPIIQPVTQSLF